MKPRSALGLLAGALILLSSAAHTIMGWTGIRAQLVEAGAPPALISGVQFGWQWGGFVMVAIAAIVIVTMVKRLRGQPVSLLPIHAFAALYIGFGAWALAVSGGQIFFLFAFVLPGILLTIAGLPVRKAE
jgi:hypothetical protein